MKAQYIGNNKLTDGTNTINISGSHSFVEGESYELDKDFIIEERCYIDCSEMGEIDCVSSVEDDYCKCHVAIHLPKDEGQEKNEDYWKRRCEAAEDVLSRIPITGQRYYLAGYEEALELWQQLKQIK